MGYVLAMQMNGRSLGIGHCEYIKRKASLYIKTSLYTYKHKDIFIYRGRGIYSKWA